MAVVHLCFTCTFQAGIMVKTIEVGKLEILAFQHLAKEVKGIGNWELFGVDNP